jgi:nicotinate-nucleotide adenylyltransferase
MKKIGLFGGTFNPIHLGHLRSAEEIYESLPLERILFIPSAYPPHKKDDRIPPAPLRGEMVQLAIAGNPHFSLSKVELDRQGKSYSVETVRHFRRLYGRQTDLYFMIGLDAFLEVNTWRQYAELFELCHFVVMTRPGFEKKFSPKHLPVELAKDFCYDKRKAGYIHRSGYGVFPKEITAFDISSTNIRGKIQKGYSVKYLLPPAVEEFIFRHKLYQAKDIESID